MNVEDKAREAKRLYQKAYKEKHKEKVSEYQKAYMKTWRRNNPDKTRVYNQRYFAKLYDKMQEDQLNNDKPEEGV